MTKGSFLTFVEMSVKRQALGIWALLLCRRRRKRKKERSGSVEDWGGGGVRDRLTTCAGAF